MPPVRRLVRLAIHSMPDGDDLSADAPLDRELERRAILMASPGPRENEPRGFGGARIQ